MALGTSCDTSLSTLASKSSSSCASLLFARQPAAAQPAARRRNPRQLLLMVLVDSAGDAAGHQHAAQRPSRRQPPTPAAAPPCTTVRGRLIRRIAPGMNAHPEVLQRLFKLQQSPRPAPSLLTPLRSSPNLSKLIACLPTPRALCPAPAKGAPSPCPRSTR